MSLPDVDQVLEKAGELAAMPADALGKRIDDELGAPQLAVFMQLAKDQLPGAPEAVLHRSVHLMVLASLLQRDLS